MYPYPHTFMSSFLYLCTHKNCKCMCKLSALCSELCAFWACMSFVMCVRSLHSENSVHCLWVLWSVCEICALWELCTVCEISAQCELCVRVCVYCVFICVAMAAPTAPLSMCKHEGVSPDPTHDIRAPSLYGWESVCTCLTSAHPTSVYTRTSVYRINVCVQIETYTFIYMCEITNTCVYIHTPILSVSRRAIHLYLYLHFSINI